MSTNLPINVKSIDHITIISSDLEATRKFYVDGLGMEEVARPDFNFPGLWFQAGAAQIHVTLESPEAGKAGWGDRDVQITSRGHHFAFEVDDAIAATETARSLGFKIAHEPKNRPDGAIQVYFFDPDGHVVELFSGP